MDANKLRGKMAEKGCTQAELAAKIGMSQQALNAKMNDRSIFKLDEMVKIIEALGLDDPGSIFFAKTVPNMQQSANQPKAS